MKDLLPELLLNIFDLVVHTPGSDELLFTDRSEVTEVEDWSTFRFVAEHTFPNFQTGITSHSTSPHTPLHLSHVCQEWRNLTFTESQLWSTIYMTNGSPGLVPLFNLWLENSGSRPLKLVFRDGQDHYQEHGNAIAEMLSLAAPHRGRWESFKIRLRYIPLPMASVAKAVASAELPSLLFLAFSFRLAGQDEDYHDFDHVWGRIVKHSPRLQEVQLWSTMDYNPGILDGIPFHQLTTLILPMVDIDAESHFMESLPQCTSLDTLSISIRNYCKSQSSELYALAIPSLHTLYVHSNITEALNTFIGALHLPSLTHLSIHTNSLTRPNPLLAGYSNIPGLEDQLDQLNVSREPLNLEEALDYWKPNLLSLSLRDEEAPKFQDFFLPLIHHDALQTLEDLKVGGIAEVEIILALTAEPSTPSPSVMPGLKTIHIESAFLNNSHPGAITKMVRSRVDSQNANHLRTIRVNFLSKNEMAQEIGQWEGVQDRRFQQVDKSFEWIGTGQRLLEREFMVEDFSMIQDW